MVLLFQNDKQLKLTVEPLTHGDLKYGTKYPYYGGARVIEVCVRCGATARNYKIIHNVWPGWVKDGKDVCRTEQTRYFWILK